MNYIGDRGLTALLDILRANNIDGRGGLGVGAANVGTRDHDGIESGRGSRTAHDRGTLNVGAGKDGKRPQPAANPADNAFVHAESPIISLTQWSAALEVSRRHHPRM